MEFRPGSLGISVLADRAEGAALFGSVWASSEAMSASEETEAPLRAELAKRAGPPVTVEDYQVPISVIFDHAILLLGGQAVRLTRIQVKPSQVDDVIEVVGDEVVPSLSEAARFPRRAAVRRPGLGAHDQRDDMAGPASAGGRPERRRDHPERIPRRGG